MMLIIVLAARLVKCGLYNYFDENAAFWSHQGEFTVTVKDCYMK